MKEYYDTLPLNDVELGYLLLIYRKRLKNFIPVFSVLLGIVLFFSIYFANILFANEDVLTISLYTAKFFFMWGSPFLLFGSIIYAKRIYAYKADANGGIKEMMPYEILEKEPFYRTNKFYFRISDPENMHYEVDEETFNMHSVGDTILISRAPRSKYTFEYGGRFSFV